MKPQTNKNRAIRLLPLALAMALPSYALGQESGWYAGLGVGRAITDIETSRILSDLQGSGFNTSRLDTDDKDTTFKVLGGYAFNANFALEGSWFDLGDFDFDATLLPAGMVSGKTSIDGFALDLVGTIPLGGRLSAFARAGINNTRIDQDFATSQIGSRIADRSDRGVNEKYGAGLEYAFSEALSLRAEVERYRLEGNRVTDDFADTFTAGFVYRFGGRPAAAPVARVAEPTPAPAQVPAPAPTPAPPREITLSANTLFDFDRSELKPEGIQALDRLLRDMAELDYDVVIVTGHTDRIGTRTYNLGLSQRRATTVRDYLVQNGVPGERITARGVNSDEPVTRPEQCTGPVSDALKACLQPDRRVVVEVTGVIEPD